MYNFEELIALYKAQAAYKGIDEMPSDFKEALIYNAALEDGKDEVR